MSTTILKSGLTIETYPPPPRGFDFGQASDTDRAAFGFPRLPAAAAALQSRIEALARTYDFIEPKFSPSRPRHLKNPLFKIKHASETQDIWAGGITFPAAGDTITWVEGIWSMPSVAAPPEAVEGTRYAVSTWVGMDGDDGSTDVLQAGCDAYVTVVGGAAQYQYSAWYEWAPGDTYPIDSIPVSQGDILHCVIRLTTGSLNSATILLGNQTRNVAHNFTITAPQGFALKGNCAEWIVESNASLGPTPQYDPVTFTNCNAGTADGASLEVGSGRTIDMTGANNQIIAHGAIVDDTSVQVSQA